MYIDVAPDYKAWVQDISPFIPKSPRISSGLFTWEQLVEEDGVALDFAILDPNSVMRPQKNYNNRFPVEIQNMDELKKIMAEQQ